MFLTIIKTQLKYLDKSVTYQIQKKRKISLKKKLLPMIQLLPLLLIKSERQYQFEK